MQTALLDHAAAEGRRFTKEEASELEAMLDYAADLLQRLREMEQRSS